MDLASLGKAAAKFGIGRVFPPTGRGLSDALIAACGRTDTMLGCGFGDTLSTNLAGRYDEVDQFASLLVVSALLGRSDEFAVACIEANPEDFDENVIGVQPITFLTVLAEELHDEVRGRAKISGSPLFGWFSVLQGDATLDEMGGLRRVQQEIAGRLAEIPALNVARIVTALGGRVALAPPKRGDWGLVGRDDDLAALHALLGRHGAAAVVPVAGLGGLGKTALALGYLAVYGERYDLVAWVDAERPELIAGQYRSLVRNRSGVEVPEAEATAAALALLADTGDWLVIFDNAAGPDEIYQYLPSGSGRVLVTTRNETWTANRDLEFRLDKLPRPAVAAWLADAGVGGDPATIDELAGRLDGLPLAVVQALGYLAARPGETAGSYLAKLGTKAGQRQVLAAGRPAGYPAAVADTWNVAVDALADVAPAALALLGCLAYVNADNVPLALLDGLTGDGPAGEAVGVLAHYGMVRFDAGLVSMHRLVQDVTRWPLTAEEEEAQVTRWAAHLRARCPEPAADHRHFVWYAAAVPHLLALLDHADELRLASPLLAETANEAGISLIEQASHSAGRALLERALSIKEAVYGPDHPGVAITMTALGDAHRELGDNRRAVELYGRALAIKEAVYGPDHPSVAVTLTNLGIAHRQLGDNPRAVELLGRALTIFEAAYGPDHPQVAITLTALGDAHQELGDHPRAVELYGRALAIKEAAYGPDHPQVAITLTNLGNAHQELGDNPRAVELLERALTIFEAAYGPDHPSVAITLTNLGDAHRQLGDHPRAVELLERALTIFEAAYGPDHPQVAITLTNLGVAHQELGDHPRAVELYGRALAIKEAVYGPDHPGVAITLGNLGVAHQQLGDNPRAVELYQRALTIFEAVYGPDHPHTVKARRLLANHS